MLSKIIFLFFIVNIHLSNGKVSDQDALSYLNKYGYVLEPVQTSKTGPASFVDSNSILKNTVTRFQLVHGLNVTGVLDEATEKKMKAPRCSLPDFRPEGNIAFYKAASKWRKKNLTYKVLNENEELKGQTRRIISEAFQFWADVSGLSFSEVNPNSKSDLSIKFGSKNHGDNYPFDGPGGVLAHAFFPEHGEIHFDEDEYFTDRKKDGSDLKIIAVHEFGHALGLEHSLTQGAVMNPYYQGYEENFKLGKDDIDGIQYLYGKANPNQLPTTTATTTRPTTTTQKLLTTLKQTQKSTTKSTTTTAKKTNIQITTTTSIVDKIMDYLPCHVSKQAVFIGSDLATVYAILEDEYGLYRFDPKSRVWKKDNIETVYPKLPLTARGGAVDDKGIIWFFNDYEVYAYNKNQLLPGYPKAIKDFLYPRHPYAAAFKNGKIYIYKNWLSYEFDVQKLKITNIHRTGTIFKGIPLHIDAAFKYNGYYYFFKDENYFKFDEKKNAVITGYPKLTSQDWFLCKN